MVEICDSPVQQEVRYDRQLRLWGEHGQSGKVLRIFQLFYV